MNSIQFTSDTDKFSFRQQLAQLTNKMLSFVEKSRVIRFDFSLDSMLAEAIRETGLSDWGDDEFMEGWQELIKSFATEADLTPIGKISQRMEFVRMLSNRLRVVQAFKDHPEIAGIPIARPLFILGYPRTGTTLLHRMLAHDPSVRVPLLWELLRSAPIAPNNNRNTDPRIRAAQVLLFAQRIFAPEINIIHPLSANQADECVFLFFNTLYFSARGHIPGYIKWFSQHNSVADYQYYKQQLQLLQWQHPGERWVLKTPFHSWTLDALLTVFPDACIVQLHRDPKKIIASWCSFIETVYRYSSYTVDCSRIGTDWLNIWREGMSRAHTVRANANRAQFFDIEYEALIANPTAEVARLYEYFGFMWDAQIEQSMRQWLASDQHKRSKPHHYLLEAYGLTPEVVDSFLPTG